MKWFKHKSKSLNDDLIFEAIERFGSDGYLVFFGTLEIMSDEFDIHQPGVSRVSIKKLTKNLQLSRQKTLRILSFFHQKANEERFKNKSFFVVFEKDHVVVKCNELAKLCDEHTRKLLFKSQESVRSQSGVTPTHRSKKKEVRILICKRNSSESMFLTDGVKEVLDYYNKLRDEMLGTEDIKPITKGDTIRTRLKEGKTVYQCCQIIWAKSKDKYFKENNNLFHPDTLFRPKHFQRYLDEYEVVRAKEG